MRAARWSRNLVIVGFVAMLLGVLDPMEGSVVILAGIALVALGARWGPASDQPLVYWSFLLVLAGVAALWALSSVGGFGGNKGRSNWWGILILPYPVGWILGLVAVRRLLRAAPMPGTQVKA